MVAEHSSVSHAPDVGRSDTLLHRARLLVRRLGVDLQRWPPARHPELNHAKLLLADQVGVVIDVGAATGSYGSALRRFGFTQRIISLEPLPSSFEQLQRTALHDPMWTVLNRAIGGESGTVRFNVAGNSDSSSMLMISDRHVHASPESATEETIDVEATTIQRVIDDLIQPSERIALKLDVQGAESMILDGTPMDRVHIIHLEQSLIELYVGSTTFDEMHQRLSDGGFELVDLIPGFRDPTTGRLLQFDGTYRRIDHD